MDIKKFLKIENKYDLYHLNIEGINVWEYSRFDIWNYVFCAEKLGLQEAHRVEKRNNLFLIIWSFFKSILHFYLSRQKNIDVCFITHERRIKENNYYDSIYSEELIKKYSNSVALEPPYNHYRHLKPVRTENIYYIDWIIIAGSLYTKIHSLLKTSKYKKIYNLISENLKKPYAEMKESYKLETTFETLVKMNVSNYFSCKVQYKMYTTLLKKFSPKVIVEVCHYSKHAMLINEIAKEMNIPILELQHGTMHSEHAAYQYMSDNPIAQLPTKILLFSEYWKTQIHLPIASENLIATGFPYFENKICEYKKHILKDKKKTILFISQGTIGKKLSAFAVELSKRLDLSKYRIIYKLHPGEYADWMRKYEWLINSNIEIVSNLDRNIYSYFAESDIQIGVYSTAIYEGIGFGLDTYIYNIGHANTMQTLVDKNYAKMFTSVDELLRMMQDEKEKYCGDVFWKDNALENQCQEIDKYLSKGVKV